METNNNSLLNQQNSDLEKDTFHFSFKDFLFMFINNWYWFVISIVICSGVAMFIYKTKPRIYQESAQILLRMDNMSKAEDVSTLLSNGGDNQTSITFRIENEIYILRSIRLMERVVKRLNLQPEYKYISMFEKHEYYHDSPIKISIFNEEGMAAEDVSLNMKVEALSNNEYKYTIEEGATQKAAFGTKVKLDDTHDFVIDKTKNLGAKFYNAYPIDISYLPSQTRAGQIVNNLTVSNISSSTKGLLEVSITSENFEKSREIIDTLIAIYNEDANEDKKQKTRKTEEIGRAHV